MLSWVYVKRAWQASSFVIFLRTVFDMSSSRARIPEVIIHSSEMIHPGIETYLRVHILFPFAAVGDAYTNISLNASKNLDGPMNQEWLKALPVFFFFFHRCRVTHPRLRANKHSRRVCENRSTPISLCETTANGFVQLATETFPRLSGIATCPTTSFSDDFISHLKEILDEIKQEIENFEKFNYI